MNNTHFASLAFLAGLAVMYGGQDPLNQGNTSSEYDPAHEVVLKGTVERVVKHTRNDRREVHVIVSVANRSVEVHIGPPHFLAWHQFRVDVNDRVEIVAAKAKGEPHFLARTVKVGDRTLVLRDERGRPLWR